MIDEQQDILVRIALTEQALRDVEKRLDKIEKSLDSINKIASMGIGVWKAVFIIGGLLGAIWSFMRITKS